MTEKRPFLSKFAKDTSKGTRKEGKESEVEDSVESMSTYVTNVEHETTDDR